MERRTVGAGRYVLLERIGEGGMASVWRSHDTRLGVERAVKLMKPAITSDTMRDRFDREARLMAQLEHPHVVPVHDVGVEDGALWMVMSLLRNGSVADHVERHGPLAPRQACRVAEGVLDALDAAHAQGIVHRDVKPQNVLVDDRGNVRLGDWGIARDHSRNLTGTGAVLGTFAYMPPEQRVSSKDADPRSDLYAVGALLVAVLLGQLPRDLFHPTALEEQTARLPFELREFVARCTQFAPEDRYPSARAALDALRAAEAQLPPDPPATVSLGTTSGGALTSGIASDSTIDSYHSPPPTIPAPAPRDRRVLAAGVLASAVILVGFLGCGAGAIGLRVWWTRAPDAAPVAGAPEPAEPVPSSTAAPAPADAAGATVAPAELPTAVPPRPDPRPVAPRAGATPPEAAPEAAPDPAPDPVPAVPAVPQIRVWIAAQPSAVLEIDKRVVGETPFNDLLDVGEHWVAFRQDGRMVLRRQIKVVEGGTLEYCWVLATEEPCSH